MAHRAPARRSPAARRTGYAAAIVVTAALVYLVNVRPGWQGIPFLTPATAQVLWLVNAALAVSLAANVCYLAYDPPWLRAAGDVVTSAVGLAAAIRVWQVFPFTFHGSASGWSVVVRVALIVVIAGSAIAILVNLVALLRPGRRR